MRKIFEQVVPPKQGFAIVVHKGQHFRLIDLEGKQVADMAVWNAENPREKLNTAWSRTRYTPKTPSVYVARDKIMEGDTLMSTLCRPLMTIVKETAEPKGVHDLYNRMCNRYLYKIVEGIEQDGCAEILGKVIVPFGLREEDVPDTMNVFMNYQHDVANNRWVIKEPVTRPGDYIEFCAEMDVIVGFSNCPEDRITLCNAKHCTPLKVEIYEAE